jgi:hypothetical protein
VIYPPRLAFCERDFRAKIHWRYSKAEKKKKKNTATARFCAVRAVCAREKRRIVVVKISETLVPRASLRRRKREEKISGEKEIKIKSGKEGWRWS